MTKDAAATERLDATCRHERSEHRPHCQGEYETVDGEVFPCDCAGFRSHDPLGGESMTGATTVAWTATYFVPKSQVHPNSRGSQSGNVHLVCEAEHGSRVALPGLRSPRRRGNPLCSPSRRAWMTREPYLSEARDQRCPRCVQLAGKLGITWPEPTW